MYFSKLPRSSATQGSATRGSATHADTVTDTAAATALDTFEAGRSGLQWIAAACQRWKPSRYQLPRGISWLLLVASLDFSSWHLVTSFHNLRRSLPLLRDPYHQPIFFLCHRSQGFCFGNLSCLLSIAQCVYQWIQTKSKFKAKWTMKIIWLKFIREHTSVHIITLLMIKMFLLVYHFISKLCQGTYERTSAENYEDMLKVGA